MTGSCDQRYQFSCQSVVAESCRLWMLLIQPRWPADCSVLFGLAADLDCHCAHARWTCLGHGFWWPKSRIFKAAQEEGFFSLNNRFGRVFQVRVTKSLAIRALETQSFAKTNQKSTKNVFELPKYDSLFDPLVLLFISLSYVLTLIFPVEFYLPRQFIP